MSARVLLLISTLVASQTALRAVALEHSGGSVQGPSGCFWVEPDDELALYLNDGQGTVVGRLSSLEGVVDPTTGALHVRAELQPHPDSPVHLTSAQPSVRLARSLPTACLLGEAAGAAGVAAEQLQGGQGGHGPVGLPAVGGHAVGGSSTRRRLGEGEQVELVAPVGPRVFLCSTDDPDGAGTVSRTIFMQAELLVETKSGDVLSASLGSMHNALPGGCVYAALVATCEPAACPRGARPSSHSAAAESQLDLPSRTTGVLGVALSQSGVLAGAAGLGVAAAVAVAAGFAVARHVGGGGAKPARASKQAARDGAAKPLVCSGRGGLPTSVATTPSHSRKRLTVTTTTTLLSGGGGAGAGGAGSADGCCSVSEVLARAAAAAAAAAAGTCAAGGSTPTHSGSSGRTLARHSYCGSGAVPRARSAQTAASSSFASRGSTPLITPRASHGGYGDVAGGAAEWLSDHASDDSDATTAAAGLCATSAFPQLQQGAAASGLPPPHRAVVRLSRPKRVSSAGSSSSAGSPHKHGASRADTAALSPAPGPRTLFLPPMPPPPLQPTPSAAAVLPPGLRPAPPAAPIAPAPRGHSYSLPGAPVAAVHAVHGVGFGASPIGTAPCAPTRVSWHGVAEAGEQAGRTRPPAQPVVSQVPPPPPLMRRG